MQKNMLTKIIFIIGVLITSAIFLLNNRSTKSPILTPTPISVINPQKSHVPITTPIFRPTISPQPAFISNKGEKVRLYINKKHGFSFMYSADLAINEETPDYVGLGDPDEIAFGNVMNGMWVMAVRVEPTAYSDPYEKVHQLNKDSHEREIKEHRVISAENFLITRRIIEKHISIDGIPALVTYKASVWEDGAEAYPERTVFFIKDKYLFTIDTRYEDDDLWSSFTFKK